MIPSAGRRTEKGVDFVIKGFNLNSCLRLALIPKNVECNLKNLPMVMEKSLAVMGQGAATVYPKVETGPDGSGTATFSGVRVELEGEFRACIIEFSTATGEEIPMLGAASVGTAVATAKPPPPGKKK